MKNMKKLLVLLSTTAVGSTGTLSLMTNQNIGSSITNIKTYSSSTYASIDEKIGFNLGIYDVNGNGTAPISIAFEKDVAKYQINDVFTLARLLTAEGKAIDSENAMFLFSELKINAVDDIFDYDYVASVEVKISNINCDVIYKYYDDKNYFTIENGTYILNFVDKDGKILGQGNYQVKAKNGTSAHYLDMISKEEKKNSPFVYQNFVYPGSPIETFREGGISDYARIWVNNKKEVPLINGSENKIPSTVKKFLSYQELIGWKVKFKVISADISIWHPLHFGSGDELILSFNYEKDNEIWIAPDTITIAIP